MAVEAEGGLKQVDLSPPSSWIRTAGAPTEPGVRRRSVTGAAPSSSSAPGSSSRFSSPSRRGTRSSSRTTCCTSSPTRPPRPGSRSLNPSARSLTSLYRAGVPPADDLRGDGRGDPRRRARRLARLRRLLRPSRRLRATLARSGAARAGGGVRGADAARPSRRRTVSSPISGSTRANTAGRAGRRPPSSFTAYVPTRPGTRPLAGRRDREARLQPRPGPASLHVLAEGFASCIPGEHELVFYLASSTRLRRRASRGCSRTCSDSWRRHRGRRSTSCRRAGARSMRRWRRGSGSRCRDLDCQDGPGSICGDPVSLRS